MAWVNTYYGKQHIDLRNTIWEKGFREGQIEGDNAPSPATFEWLDKAINAYYKDRVIKLLSQIETKPHHIILKEWEELVYDICGDNQTAKNELFNLIASDTAYSQSIKDWVKQYFQSI